MWAARCSTSSPSGRSPPTRWSRSPRAAAMGTEVSYGDKTLKVQGARALRFLRRRHLPDVGGLARSRRNGRRRSPPQGAVVIDNSSCWRYDPDVPLIVPEVNADAVAGFRKKGIIANPNCSTAQLVVALKPLHDKAKIKRVVVATYQSVSGAGKEAMDELFAQTKSVYSLDEVEAEEVPQAHRLQPHSAYRRVHGGRLHQGRVEDGGRDQENPRSQDQAHRHLRARAGVHRPFRGGQHRVREPDHGRRGARDPAQRAGLPRHRQARARRLRRRRTNAAGEDATYISRIREDRDGRERPRAVGASPTICARARRSTPSRSPSA